MQRSGTITLGCAERDSGPLGIRNVSILDAKTGLVRPLTTRAPAFSSAVPRKASIATTLFALALHRQSITERASCRRPPARGRCPACLRIGSENVDTRIHAAPKSHVRRGSQRSACSCRRITPQKRRCCSSCWRPPVCVGFTRFPLLAIISVRTTALPISRKPPSGAPQACGAPLASTERASRGALFASGVTPRF